MKHKHALRDYLLKKNKQMTIRDAEMEILHMQLRTEKGEDPYHILKSKGIDTRYTYELKNIG